MNEVKILMILGLAFCALADLRNLQVPAAPVFFYSVFFNRGQ